MNSAYATSDDGLDWSWHGIVLEGRPGSWSRRGARLTTFLADGRAAYARPGQRRRRTGSSRTGIAERDGDGYRRRRGAARRRPLPRGARLPTGATGSTTRRGCPTSRTSCRRRSWSARSGGRAVGEVARVRVPQTVAHRHEQHRVRSTLARRKRVPENARRPGGTRRCAGGAAAAACASPRTARRPSRPAEPEGLPPAAGDAGGAAVPRPPRASSGHSARMVKRGRRPRGRRDRAGAPPEVAAHLDRERRGPRRRRTGRLERVVPPLGGAGATQVQAPGRGNTDSRTSGCEKSGSGTTARPVTEPSGCTVPSSAQRMSASPPGGAGARTARPGRPGAGSRGS